MRFVYYLLIASVTFPFLHYCEKGILGRLLGFLIVICGNASHLTDSHLPKHSANE